MITVSRTTATPPIFIGLWLHCIASTILMLSVPTANSINSVTSSSAYSRKTDTSAADNHADSFAILQSFYSWIQIHVKPVRTSVNDRKTQTFCFYSPFFHNASLTNQKRPAVSQQVFRLNPMYRHHLPSDSAVSVPAPAEAP